MENTGHKEIIHAMKHILLTAAPTWSHFRTVCVLAAKFVAERPILVTLLVPHYRDTFEKAQQEVERCLADAESVSGTIRVIAMGAHSQEHQEALEADIPAFRIFWKQILDCSPLACAATGNKFLGAPKPSLVIMDPMLCDVFAVIRNMDPESSPRIPVLSWVMAFTGAMIAGALPMRYGGLAEFVLPKFSEEEMEHGRRVKIRGRVRHVRGMPDMYEWEYYPQDLLRLPIVKWTANSIPLTLHKFTKMLFEADGLATAGTVGYDGEEILSVIDEWMAENGRVSYHLGPILPLKPETGEFSQRTLDADMAATPAGVGKQVLNFLDAALKSKGEHSVIYICFGSNFWPNNPGHLWMLLETLSERAIPFILSHPSSVAHVPDHISNRFLDTADSLLVPWAPQQTILAHKSIGWFITHGGQGGTMDALTQGVPMIGWPLMGDEPANVAHLVHTLDVAFEFLEVRTGEYGLKPVYLAGKTPTATLESFREELKSILDDLTSEVGQRKRANAQKQQKILAGAWAPGGPAHTAFQSLIQKFDI